MKKRRKKVVIKLLQVQVKIELKRVESSRISKYRLTRISS